MAATRPAERLDQDPGPARGAPSLDEALDPRRNGLNALRLGLALLVIVWHSFPLTGHDIAWSPLHQILSRISVDGFFCISGYLILQSWTRTPRWSSFLRARALRIFPAFWVSLAVTAFVLAPVAWWTGQGPLPDGFWRNAAGYVGENSALWVIRYDVVGSPSGVPLEGVWNGSMWTLSWEFLCYLGVLALGVSTLLRRSWVVPAAFAAMVGGVLATSYGPVDNSLVIQAARFGVMFLAGMLVFQLRRRLRLTGVYLCAAAATVLVSALLPDYRVVSAFPLAYLMIGLGALGRSRWVQARQDLSYGTYIFAFPLQQLLAGFGLWKLGVPVFALVSVLVTLPVAAASWFGIERPALRLKSRRKA